MDPIYFSTAVEYYTTNRPYFYAFVRPYELEMFHRLTSTFQRPILDFGCGDGFFARFLSELTPIDFGVDYDPSILPDAQQVYAQVVRSDTQMIPLPAESVRTIFSNSVFEHLHQPASMLRELYRILQPGGKLYTTVTTKQWEEALLGVSLFGSLYRAWFRKIQHHHAWFTCDEWQNIFYQAGFCVNSTQGYLQRRHVRAIEASHYLSWPVFLAKLVSGRWNSRLSQIMNAMLATIFKPLSQDAATEIAVAPCIFFEIEKPVE